MSVFTFGHIGVFFVQKMLRKLLRIPDDEPVDYDQARVLIESVRDSIALNPETPTDKQQIARVVVAQMTKELRDLFPEKVLGSQGGKNERK